MPLSLPPRGLSPWALAIEGGEAAYQPPSSAEEVIAGSVPVVPGGKDAAPPQFTNDPLGGWG